MQVGTSPTAPLTVLAAGNVGISTTSPSARLNLIGSNSGTAFSLRIQDSGFTDRLVFLDNGNLGLATTTPFGYLQVGTHPTNPGLIVTTGNNVGIGTTGPSDRLEVAEPNKKSLEVRPGTNYVSLLSDGTEIARLWP